MDEFLRRVIDGEYILEENRKRDKIKKKITKIIQNIWLNQYLI